MIDMMPDVRSSRGFRRPQRPLSAWPPAPARLPSSAWLLRPLHLPPSLRRPLAAWMLVSASLTGCAQTSGHESASWELGAPVFEVGGLTDDERYALGEVVGGIRLDDGRVVVADRLAYGLKMFSADGDFLAEVGGEGQGPGEFEYLRGMSRCAEDRIVAFQIDWDENRYDLDLNFVGTRPADIDAVGGRAYELACNEDGYVLATGWGDLSSQFQEGFYVATAPVALLRDGELVHDFGERLSSERVGMVGADGNPSGSGPHPFGRSLSMAVGPEHVYLGDGADYRVEVYDLEGDRLPDITCEGPDLSLSPDAFDALLERMVADAAPSDRPSVRRRWRDLPRLERYPAYDRLVTDVDGHLWVRHVPRADADSATWHVFRSGGERLGEVHLPLRATLLDAGSDWVLVSEPDDLDVPTVRVYPLIR